MVTLTRTPLYLGGGVLGTLALVAGLDMVLTGTGHRFNISSVLLEISPYAFASMGISLCLGLSIIGAALGMWTTATSILGSATKEGTVQPKNLIGIIFCEVVAIYGFVVVMLLKGKLTGKAKIQGDGRWPYEAYYSGFAIFWAGITSGFANLFCGIAVGVTGANCAIGEITNPTLFVKALIVQIFVSIIGIVGLISAMMISRSVVDF